MEIIANTLAALSRNGCWYELILADSWLLLHRVDKEKKEKKREIYFVLSQYNYLHEFTGIECIFSYVTMINDSYKSRIKWTRSIDSLNGYLVDERLADLCDDWLIIRIIDYQVSK